MPRLSGNGVGRPGVHPQASRTFELDPAFAATAQAVGALALSHVRLQSDARFPWIVLIPRLSDARELEDLAPGERDVLMEEILRAGTAVRTIPNSFGRPTA